MDMYKNEDMDELAKMLAEFYVWWVSAEFLRKFSPQRNTLRRRTVFRQFTTVVNYTWNWDQISLAVILVSADECRILWERKISNYINVSNSFSQVFFYKQTFYVSIVSEYLD